MTTLNEDKTDQRGPMKRVLTEELKAWSVWCAVMVIIFIKAKYF